MLQAVSDTHDDHHTRAASSSVASVTASLSDAKVHLLLAASGSVATIKLPNMILGLAGVPNLSIRVVLTPAAARFLGGQAAEQPTVSSLASLPNVDGVHVDEDEWREPWRRGHAILHIELRRWADLLVIAPLSANTMAKIVAGMADGLLTSVVRAWDARRELDSDVDRSAALQSSAAAAAGSAAGAGAVADQNEGGSGKRRPPKRIIVAPAMNTAMWRHPITAKKLRVLEEEWGVGPAGDGDGWFEVLQPQQKLLACGDIGDGGMMEWTDIVEIIKERLATIA